MFDEVITRDDDAAAWPARRARIRQRILASMGTPSCPLPGATACRTTAQLTEYGLQREDIVFEVLPGLSCHGHIYHAGGTSLPGAVCIHGTNRDLACKAVAAPELKPDLAYAVELARLGFLAITVDQFGFGRWCGEDGEEALYRRFFSAHPDWSLDGMRLHVQRCAIDVLRAHPLADPTRTVCIGNSLGGRSALHLAAFDERICGAAVSTGVSPNLTNVYRNTATDPCLALSPRLNAAIADAGRPPWEYPELLALVAPRTLLLIEPYNDPYNPFIEATTACFLAARRVYELLGAPQRLAMLCHGNGHGTAEPLRAFAYAMLRAA